MKALSAFALIGGLHYFAAPAALASGQTIYSFAPGDLGQWTQVTIPGGDSLDRRFFATGSNFGNRITWTDPAGSIGGLVVTTADNVDSRDGAHNAAVLRSPSFVLNGTNPEANLGSFSPTEISFKLLAGRGNATAPANFSSLPAVSVSNAGDAAYLGVGLRRAGDDAYLLWGRRTTNEQGNAWQTVTWNAAALTAATAGDAPGTLYTLDLIDAAHGSWGWMAMDSLTMIDADSLVSVSVSPLDTVGAETSADQDLSVRFTRTGNLSAALEVPFFLEGTASEFADFEEISNHDETGYVVSFPAGQATADVLVHIIPNETAEIDRSVRFRIVESSEYAATAPYADLWISDLPSAGGLVSASGPFATGTYLPIQNPFSDGTAGSLLFYGEGNHATGFLVLGVRGVPLDSSTNGGFDIGRNGGSAGAAIFDYLDNKGAASATARVPGSPEIPIQPGGHYTVIGEIEMHADNTGNLRAWIWDGANGSLDYAAPHIATPFAAGFTGLGEQIFLRLDGAGGGNSWTNARAIWVAGTDEAAREAAFLDLAPVRPFLHVDLPVNTAGEFGANTEVVFNIVRSGPPEGVLEVPFEFIGTATAADFTVPFPTSVSFADGQSSVQCVLPILADTLYEGDEVIAIEAQSSMDWLLPLTGLPSATVADRPFQGWMASQLPGSSEGPEDDSDGDSWANVLEYFFGSLPGDPSSIATSGLAAGESSTLRFQRDPSASDVDAKVLWSTDLTNWRQSGESEGSLTVTITETIVETSGAGIQTVDAAAEVTAGDATELFLRLSVDFP
ncbi:hypothetical protein [Luteolibacter sp. Populi]|uniref:hypothetical protein n=1 Tax=Luteolibacter sp. Populi TaxID=3230487 RepID=UPI003467631B